MWWGKFSRLWAHQADIERFLGSDAFVSASRRRQLWFSWGGR
jgi:hypothetical protein